jgi:site-specific DNA recombinase
MRAAIYARFSTDKQRQESLDDQIAACRELCRREQFTVESVFHDAGVSGGTTERRGYQDLLLALRSSPRRYDIVIAEDLSRLWRNQAEQAPRLAELRDLGIHVLTVSGTDSRSEGFDLVASVIGSISEMQRKEIGYRVRRGLKGNALRRTATGGRAYGYRDAGKVVDQEQAVIVQTIFEQYAAGFSPLSIAQRLNALRVPSPGSLWKRTERRRDGSWMPSAILAILNNERYIGRIVWNRCRWVRSARDSKKRRRILNPESEWVIYTDESLRVVPNELWTAVKDRQQAAHQAIGDRISRGIKRSSAQRTGRQPRYLLSGMLRCECGSTLTMVNKVSYRCSASIAGACTNSHLIRREAAERAVLAGTQEALQDPAIIDEISRRVRQELRRPRQTKDWGKERQRVLGEIENLVTAIATQGLQSSPTLAARLRSTESELAWIETQASRLPDPERLLANLEELVRKRVSTLADVATAAPEKARAALKQQIGDRITVTYDKAAACPVGLVEISGLRLLTGSGPSAEFMVAGVCYPTFLRRIPLR